MDRRLFEPEGAQQGNQLDFVFLVGGKLDEADALDGGPFRHRRPGHAADAEMAAHLIAKIDQRAVAVGGNRPRQTASKLVVEDLQGEIPVIPCRRDGFGEGRDGQVAFTRHISEMAAPIEQVHVDQRSIGKLDDEDLLFGESSGWN